MESERSEPIEVSDKAAHPLEEPCLLYCPVCSARLAESRCKLVCQQCGYFMSCADYY